MFHRGLVLTSLVVLTLPAAMGCVVVKNGGGAKDKKAAVQLPANTADDRPAGYQETSGVGFWVWRGNKAWHVRTTSGGKEHNFHGEIAVRGGGVMTDLKANRTELNDRVRGNPSGAAFEFRTSRFEDGISFKADPGGCIEFELLIDGKPHPDKINIGGRQVHPETAWFKLCE